MQVQFLTTGGGKWRASPNLYNTGKVCCHALAMSFTGLQSGPKWYMHGLVCLHMSTSTRLVYVATPKKSRVKR